MTFLRTWRGCQRSAKCGRKASRRLQRRYRAFKSSFAPWRRFRSGRRQRLRRLVVRFSARLLRLPNRSLGSRNRSNRSARCWRHCWKRASVANVSRLQGGCRTQRRRLKNSRIDRFHRMKFLRSSVRRPLIAASSTISAFPQIVGATENSPRQPRKHWQRPPGNDRCPSNPAHAPGAAWAALERPHIRGTMPASPAGSTARSPLLARLHCCRRSSGVPC